MNQRKWITREEIAEIYDGMAIREAKVALSSLDDIASLASLEDANEHIIRRNDFAKTAQDIRDTEECRPLVLDNGFYVRSGRNNW